MERRIVIESCYQIRKNARESLKDNLRLALLGMLLFTLLYFGPAEIFNYLFPPIESNNLLNDLTGQYQEATRTEVGASPISGLYSLLVTGPLVIGAAYFLLSISKKHQLGENKPGIHQIFEGFNNYFRSLGTYLWMMLFTVLWMMLAFIPWIISLFVLPFIGINSNVGMDTIILLAPLTIIILLVIAIIVSLRYSLLFIIVADNKNIGIRESLKTSINLMKGNKVKLFTLTLSYFGWLILNLVVASIVAWILTMILGTFLSLDLITMINNILLAIAMVGVITYMFMGYIEFYKLAVAPEAVNEEIKLTTEEE